MFASQFSLSTISPRNKHLIALALVIVVFALAGVLIWWFSKSDGGKKSTTDLPATSAPTTESPGSAAPTEPPKNEESSDKTKGETFWESLGNAGRIAFVCLCVAVGIAIILAVAYFRFIRKKPGNLELRKELGKLVDEDYSDTSLETILLQTMQVKDPKVQDLRQRLFKEHKSFMDLFETFSGKEYPGLMKKSLSEIRQETANAFDKSKKDVYDEFQKYHGDYQFTPAEMRAKAFHLGSSKGIEL